MESAVYFGRVERRLAKIADPVDRARLLNEEIAAVSDVLVGLGRLRTNAVQAARDGKSVQTIANDMGVTRARVYQILQGRD